MRMPGQCDGQVNANASEIWAFPSLELGRPLGADEDGADRQGALVKRRSVNRREVEER
jgi:hypothetical protein